MPSERTRRKAKLGRYMEALRERVEPRLIPERVAELLETSRTTVSRLESGNQRVNLHLLHALLGLYGATEEERAEAVSLWRAARQDTTVVEYQADLHAKYVAFRRDERDAVAEYDLELSTVPGQLQTTAYAAAIAAAAHRFNVRRGPDWEERATAERLDRQRLLEGPSPLRLHVLLGEGVIGTVVGGPAVMAEQLRHLLEMGERDNITIQIVPFTAGAVGTMSGPAIVLEFDDPEDPYSVYLESAAGGDLVDNDQDVAAFLGAFEDTVAVALPAAESAARIQAALDELTRDDGHAREVAHE
ncbi:helix-turn-helix domain-containing protein [Amycolatopsis cihanbeyliensis]|nr:helix-turn-helix transcriptional regulator [Amycolatopsis cihanbeyliensis]